MLNLDADETARLIDHLERYGADLLQRIQLDAWDGPRRLEAQRELAENDRWLAQLRGRLLLMPSPAAEVRHA